MCRLFVHFTLVGAFACAVVRADGATPGDARVFDIAEDKGHEPMVARMVGV